MIAYDPSPRALFSPERQETMFLTGQDYSARQLALEAARLAYVRAEQSELQQQRLVQALGRIGFAAPRLFGGGATGAQAFGTLRPADGTALVAFRGTQPDELADLATDARANTVPWRASGGQVHAGFAAAALSLMPAIEDWLARDAAQRSRLILGGHSLGAAVATLAASAWRPTLLATMGSPRMGDAAFAATLAGVASERIVDCCDVVTELPPELPPYTHIGPLLYIDKDGAVLERPSAEEIAEDRSSGRAAYLLHHAVKIGSLPVRDLADHAPINYLRAFFP